jgi:hypothetical protein
VTKVFASRSSSGEVLLLCPRCLARVPPKPRFNYKQHRAEGIRNLERFDQADSSAETGTASTDLTPSRPETSTGTARQRGGLSPRRRSGIVNPSPPLPFDDRTD